MHFGHISLHFEFGHFFSLHYGLFFVNTLAVPTDLLVAAVDLFTRRVAVHVGHSGARGVYPVHDYVRHRPVCVCVLTCNLLTP